jgi:hypothetical protein
MIDLGGSGRGGAEIAGGHEAGRPASATSTLVGLGHLTLLF